MKKTIIIIVLVLLLLLSIIILTNSLNKKSLNNINKIQIDQIKIKNRTTIKIDNIIYVGENIKEIENGYYDLKIVNEENTVDIYLNKLWYKNFNESYIQDDYLVNICHEIVNNIKVNKNKEELEYLLYKYVKENYLSSRSNKPTQSLLLENLTLSLMLEDDIPKLEIKGV